MTAPPLFDTHAHLHFPELVADLDGVLERARAAGVIGMVTIGTDRETNPAAVALAERFAAVCATVGIHPHDAAEATDGRLRGDGRARRGSAKVVALGEMGLDFFRNLSPPDVQDQVFRRQLAMARDLGKPVVIHCRDAHAEALAHPGRGAGAPRWAGSCTASRPTSRWRGAASTSASSSRSPAR